MNRKILVIEDEVTLRQALKEKLSKAGMTVFEAKDGIEGMQMAIQNSPDLILLDIIMPKENGIDFLKNLKDSPALSQTPVYILTNLSNENDKKLLMNLGAEDYIVKSNIKIGDLAEKIKKRLGA